METNQNQPLKPNSHMPMAIISTVLTVITCTFIPAIIFGIVSIVYASKVNSKFAIQDYEAAEKASKNAKVWWIVTLISIVVIWVVSILFADQLIPEEVREEFMKEYNKSLQEAKANQ
ncbi:MAG: CD225/dispanin family protein [Psychroflexus sp.]